MCYANDMTQQGGPISVSYTLVTETVLALQSHDVSRGLSCMLRQWRVITGERAHVQLLYEGCNGRIY